MFTTQIAVILKSEKHETTVAYCGFSTIKCQHHVADMAYSPHFQQEEKRVTANNKHVLSFDRCRALTASA